MQMYRRSYVMHAYQCGFCKDGFQAEGRQTWLKLVMMILKPSPSSPRRFSTGTLTSSKSTHVVPAAHCPPIFIFLVVTPSVRGMSRMETPFASPGFPDVLTAVAAVGKSCSARSQVAIHSVLTEVVTPDTICNPFPGGTADVSARLLVQEHSAIFITHLEPLTI
jgi:hypothetical protein